MKSIKKTSKKESSSKTSASKVKTVNLNDLTGNELFMYSLREIGQPALVRDMVKKIKGSKLVSISKKKLLAKLYASASQLNKSGLVKRIPVNGSMYMYSLLNWKLNKASIQNRLAA